MRKNKIGERQLALLKLLKDNPKKRYKQQEIAKELSGYYSLPDPSSLNFHDSSTRLKITMDIRKLNESEDIQDIIISDASGVYIANDIEKATYISNQFAQVYKKLELTRRKAEKANIQNNEISKMLNIKKRG